MKLETGPKNIAHMENVGTAKEFSMKATAKSFEILSSSLYSNPIRAIIRELSTNAYDSHVEAKNTNPFDVHLPTSLEPFFYIRDYGIGLSAEQVENIYITYFDSNKNENNDLVGGLGLGSKSPFSYTQNFTITAIKNGMKSLFSAFINDEGIPAIVKMGEVASNEPSGVEIKFAVDKDFYKFEEEAKYVYKYFSMKPNFIGKKIDIATIEFETKNAIPNLHILKNHSYRTGAIALMGNIPYPINVPNADRVLGSLKVYQDFAIMIEFPIGDVQFQASREGLHYTKNTVQAIGRKFKELDDSLYSVFQKEMDGYDNVWKRSVAFNKKEKSNAIWYNPAMRYMKDFPDNVISDDMYFDEKTYEKFNLKLEVYKYDSWSGTAKTQKDYINIDPSDTMFVENDTKVGIVNRVKYHLKNNQSTQRCYVIIALDKNKEVDYNGFYNFIKNPPEDCKVKASNLDTIPKKERNYNSTKNVGVMKLVVGNHHAYDAARRYKWEAHMFDNLDQTKTYYYIPLSGYTPIYEILDNSKDVKNLFEEMRDSTLPDITNIHVYGVRKSDIDKIKGFKNWIKLETYLKDTIDGITAEKLMTNAIHSVDGYVKDKYNEEIAKLLVNKNTAYHKILNYTKGQNPKSLKTYKAKSFVRLFSSSIDIDKISEEAEANARKLIKTYPLLQHIKSNAIDYNAVAEYVNFIDMKKE
jgi:hypothetical protein